MGIGVKSLEQFFYFFLYIYIIEFALEENFRNFESDLKRVFTFSRVEI